MPSFAISYVSLAGVPSRIDTRARCGLDDGTLAYTKISLVKTIHSANPTSASPSVLARHAFLVVERNRIHMLFHKKRTSLSSLSCSEL